MNYCYDDNIAEDCNGRPYCTLCGTGVMPWANVQSHLDGQRHQSNLQNSFANQTQDASDSESTTTDDDLPEHIERDNEGRPYCSLCGTGPMSVAVMGNHLNGQRHRSSLQNLYANQQENDSESEASNDDLPEHIERDNEGRPFCALCGTGPMSLAVMGNHLNGQRHQNNLPRSVHYGTDEDDDDEDDAESESRASELPDHIERNPWDGYLYCTLCDTGRMNLGNVYSHINGARHQENLPSRYGNRSGSSYRSGSNQSDRTSESSSGRPYAGHWSPPQISGMGLWNQIPRFGGAPTAQFAPVLSRPQNASYLDELERRGAAMAKDPEAVECSICLIHLTGHNEEITLPCEHTFHKPCLANWLSEKQACPLCRVPILVR